MPTRTFSARALLAFLVAVSLATGSPVGGASGIQVSAPDVALVTARFERVDLAGVRAGPSPLVGRVAADRTRVEPDPYIPLPRDGVAGAPPESRPVSAPEVAPVATPAPKPAPKAAATYVGRNHVWMPSLGINRTVYSFPCSRTEEPANVVYRWGCAGANNVYLFGHAYGVFKPLHDAYYNGKLRVGMVVYYADPNGRVRRYKVTTWRVVRPDQFEWAIAAQSVPSMTLQTCLGANSEYRLNVRLVAS